MRELKNKGLTPFTDQKRTTVPDRYAKSKPDLIHCGLIKQSPDSTYKLVGDITYLSTEKGWLYLSCCVRAEYLHGGGLDRCWIEREPMVW